MANPLDALLSERKTSNFFLDSPERALSEKISLVAPISGLSGTLSAIAFSIRSLKGRSKGEFNGLRRGGGGVHRCGVLQGPVRAIISEHRPSTARSAIIVCGCGHLPIRQWLLYESCSPCSQQKHSLLLSAPHFLRALGNTPVVSLSSISQTSLVLHLDL